MKMFKKIKQLIYFFVSLFILVSTIYASQLYVRQDTSKETISVFRRGDEKPILTQNTQPNFRPYIHPIIVPDKKGVLTEYSPMYNKHQTGLFWGFTNVNGLDYFHNPGGKHWKRVSSMVLKPRTSALETDVQWQTVYHLLDDKNEAILRETQFWTMRDNGDSYILDLKWSGTAIKDITIGEHDYGGLFLRMPWRKGINSKVVNSIRQTNEQAEGKRAAWLDIGMQLEGREDFAHIAIFDHPDNSGHPQPWRVDSEFGVGPVRARLGDWSISKGETVEIHHQILIYTGKLNDMTLTHAWSSYVSDYMTKLGRRDRWGEGRKGIISSQWGLAKEEGYQAKFLTPEQAVASMTIPNNFTVNVFASEPMITQPMAFCWDDRGRMWIAENRDMMGSGSGIQYSGESRILILEDTDRDGDVDTRKVFMDGVVFPSALAVGFDGVWLGAPPNLLFIPDRDGDDKADMDDIEVLLTGWGNQDLHETLNSFHWGPDGWLYGLQGVFTPSSVGKPAGPSKIFQQNARYPDNFNYEGEPIDLNGAVWRYHPTKKQFEVVAHGFSNPWGIDYDAKGQIFITNCVIPHLWHVVPGGIYHRQAGSHFNPNAYTDIKTIGNHRHRSAHGGARFYLSDAFPEEYTGQLFMGNIHEHAILIDSLERNGSGFIGYHGQDFLKANNAQFVGFSTEIGPEGAVYVLDWHDADICGDTVRTKDTGRIYRILPDKPKSKNWVGRYNDINSFNNFELVELQLSNSSWHARRARIVLQNRATKGEVGVETFDKLFNILKMEKNVDHRLRALWALHITGGININYLEKLLNDDSEYIRSWSIQLLCEDMSPSKTAIKKFTIMAKNDPSPVVRRYLASALQRIKPKYRWMIAENLVKHNADTADHNIPKILWYGIEPIIADNPKMALELSNQSHIPLLTRHIARRLTVANHLEILVNEIGKNDKNRKLLLLGMRDGLDGQNNLVAPSNWVNIYRKLRRTNDESGRIALQLSLKFGDEVAAATLLETVLDNNNTLTDRQRAIHSLANKKHPDFKNQLGNLLQDDSIRKDIIRAIAHFETDYLGEMLLKRYPEFSPNEKLEVIHTLSSRPNYGSLLTQAIDRGDIKRNEVPVYIARILLRIVGNRFLEVWGPIEGISPNTEAKFLKYQRLLTDNTLDDANPYIGKQIFKQTCISCHKLHGEGGLVGPDLTGANRTDINYLLGNIVTPNAIIRDDYKMTIVSTDDGMVYSGVIKSENTHFLELRVANLQEPVKIPKSQIMDREITAMSMMPEGLIEHLSDQQIINLFSYLRNLSPMHAEQ